MANIHPHGHLWWVGGAVTYNPKIPTEADIASLQNAINQKANASTVGGIVTALNSKASQSALDALAAQKADAAALQAKADAASVAQALAAKADAAALASKADTAAVTQALATKADATALTTKADTSAVAQALSTKADASALAAKADVSALAAKADASALASKADVSALAAKANTADLPKPADAAPKAESTSPAIGSDMKYAREDHQHPRLSSTTIGAIASNGTATVSFTRTFPSAPGMVITEIPGTAPPQTMPATFKVESWVREAMTPTPSGAYTGAVIRAWRSQVLPTQTALSLTALLTGVIAGVNTLIASLTGFNVFGASVAGTAFSCIAIQRSDS